MVATVGAQKTYVLAVGVSNYGPGNEDANLKSATKDTKELARLFKERKATVSVLTSRYACRDSITKRLSVITSLAKPGDNIIFTFAGHGGPGGIYLYGLEKLTYDDLNAMLANAATDNIFFFIDACRSGSAAESISAYDIKEGSKPVYCISCRAEESAMENLWIGNGYFSKALLKGLRGLADANRDKDITLIELFKYVHSDVTKRAEGMGKQQHPQLIGPTKKHSRVIVRW